MKVREYIEELKKLDQEKGIWVCCDTFSISSPMPDETAEGYFVDYLEKYYNVEIEEGDYIINAM